MALLFAVRKPHLSLGGWTILAAIMVASLAFEANGQHLSANENRPNLAGPMPGANGNRQAANRDNANAEAIDPGKAEDTVAPTAPPSQFPLPFERRYGTIKPDAAAIRARIEALVTQPDVADPIVLRLMSKNPLALVKQLARNDILRADGDMPDGKVSAEILAKSLALRQKDDKLTLAPDDLGWMDLEKLGSLLGNRTVLPSLKADRWRVALESPDTRRALEFYFQGQFSRVAASLESWLTAHPDRDQVPFEVLLPKTVRPLYGKYSHLRGRNCFGTALEFATPRSALNKTINVEREEGHYRTMINSDEFMRALWLGYYELKAEEILMGLKWGDVVVFYEDTPPVTWMSLRHAAIHVAGDVYFHKQSKSAASPIEFTDWQSIMNVWTRLTPNLGYKVFRRLPAGSSFQKPNRAIEKLSWTR